VPEPVVEPEPEPEPKLEPAPESERDREDRILREKWPMVKYVADRMKARMPVWCDVEDLQASAAAGLLDAHRRFDPARGIKFESYAPHRMRGFVLDDLRAMDWVPRLTRTRSNRLEAAYDRLEAKLGRVPTDKELAGELGMSIEEFGTLALETRGITAVPLKRRQLEKEPVPLAIGNLPDVDAESPIDLVGRADVFQRIREILPPQQAEVVDLYYQDDLTLKEIGRVLGLSESRVCQLHAKAIANLKRRFR
jgi:RNA polymerase sigma factor for flagellar operon FliA